MLFLDVGRQCCPHHDRRYNFTVLIGFFAQITLRPIGDLLPTLAAEADVLAATLLARARAALPILRATVRSGSVAGSWL